jgi:hypothetical protein
MEASTLQRPCGATKRYDRLLVEDARIVDPSTGWVRRVRTEDEAIGSSTARIADAANIASLSGRGYGLSDR